MGNLNLKEGLSSNRAVWLASVLLVGFALGISLMLFLQEHTGLVLIPRHEQTELGETLRKSQDRQSTLAEANSRLEKMLDDMKNRNAMFEKILSDFETVETALSTSIARVKGLEQELEIARNHAKSLEAEVAISSSRNKQILSLKQVLKKTREDLETSARDNQVLLRQLDLVNQDYKAITHPAGIEGPKILYDSHLIRINELSEYFDGALTVAITDIDLSSANLRINSNDETHELGVGQVLEIEIDRKKYGFRVDRLRLDSFIYMSVLLLNK